MLPMRHMQARVAQPPPLDIKVVGRPEKFAGERSRWREWQFICRSFIVMLMLFTVAELDYIESAEQELRLEVMSEVYRAKASQLWYVLSQLLLGSALKLMQRCQFCNGIEAWRQLHRYFGDRGTASTTGQLHQILDYEFGDNLEILPERLEEWRLLVNQYNVHQSLAGELFDEVCKAVLVQGMPEPLKTQLQVAEGPQTFDRVLTMAENFVRTRRDWHVAPSQQLVKAEPMDVSFMGAMKGKFGKGQFGKGKFGKGKGEGKGKGKGISTAMTKMAFMGRCFLCGQMGHKGAECPHQTAAEDEDWDDQGGDSLQCHTCGGWGHPARFCSNRYFGNSMEMMVQQNGLSGQSGPPGLNSDVMTGGADGPATSKDFLMMMTLSPPTSEIEAGLGEVL